MNFVIYYTAVIVRQGCSVKELMSAFEKELERRCLRENRTAHLSWSACFETTFLISAHVSAVNIDVC